MKAHEAWKIIKEMNWGMDSDYDGLAGKWFRELGRRKMVALHKFVGRRAEELYAAVQRHEMIHPLNPLEVGSDDSFSDLRYHIVGLGLEIFEMNLENPQLMDVRYRSGDYKESFDYVFLKPTVVMPIGKKAYKNAVVKLVSSLQEVNDRAGDVEKKLERLKDAIHNLEDTQRIIERYHKEQSNKVKETA